MESLSSGQGFEIIETPRSEGVDFQALTSPQLDLFERLCAAVDVPRGLVSFEVAQSLLSECIAEDELIRRGSAALKGASRFKALLASLGVIPQQVASAGPVLDESTVGRLHLLNRYARQIERSKLVLGKFVELASLEPGALRPKLGEWTSTALALPTSHDTVEDWHFERAGVSGAVERAQHLQVSARMVIRGDECVVGLFTVDPVENPTIRKFAPAMTAYDRVDIFFPRVIEGAGSVR